MAPIGPGFVIALLVLVMAVLLVVLTKMDYWVAGGLGALAVARMVR